MMLLLMYSEVKDYCKQYIIDFVVTILTITSPGVACAVDFAVHFIIYLC